MWKDCWLQKGDWTGRDESETSESGARQGRVSSCFYGNGPGRSRACPPSGHRTAGGEDAWLPVGQDDPAGLQRAPSFLLLEDASPCGGQGLRRECWLVLLRAGRRCLEHPGGPGLLRALDLGVPAGLQLAFQ